MSFDHRIFWEWKYRVVLTQNDASASDCGILISLDTEGAILLKSFVLGKDAYAADRVVRVSIEDSAGNRVRTIASASMNNLRMEGPSFAVLDTKTTAAASSAQSNIGVLNDHWVVGSDVIRIEAEDLAQNEQLTITLRALLIANRKPTITLVGTNTTKSEAYNTIGE